MGKEGQPKRIQNPKDSAGGGGHLVAPSLDDILAIGRARADEEARKHLSDLERAQAAIDEARGLLSLNALSPREFSIVEARYRSIVSFPEEKPALKQAIERVKTEEQKSQKAPQEKKKEKNKEVKPRLTLPKGLKLSLKAKELITVLAPTSKDSLLPGEKLDRELYRGIPRKVRRHRRHLLIASANKKLEGTGFKIINAIPHGSIKGGSFYLERPEQAVQALEVAVSKPEKVKKVQEPKGEIVELPDGKKIFLSKLEKTLVEGLLACSPEHPGSISELGRLVYGENFQKGDIHKKMYSLLAGLKAKLRNEGWQIINTTSQVDRFKGKEGQHYLAPRDTLKQAKAVEAPKVTKEEKTKEVQKERMIEGAEDKHAGKREPRPEYFRLPDGKPVRGKAGLFMRLAVQASQENLLTFEKVLEVIYGESKTVNTKRAAEGIIEYAQKIIKGTDLELVLVNEGEKVGWYLKGLGWEIPEIRQEVSVQEEREEHAVFERPQVSISQAPSQDLEELPYTFSPEEKRSEEETKILDTIASTIISSGRVRFDDLQRQLRNDVARIKIVGGEEWYYYYQASELISKFFFGFTKLRVESEISNIRERWSEEDKKLWEKIQSLTKKLSGGDVDDFRKKIREEIQRAERVFYRDNPPENGYKKGWIRVRRQK